MAKQTSEERRVNIYLNAQQADASLKQLRAGVNQLRNELAHLKPGSQEFIAKKAQFQEMNGRLKGLENNIKGVGGAWNEFKGSVQNFAPGVAFGGLLAIAIAKVTSAIGSLLPMNAELSDALADVRKTTGLTQESVDRLNNSLKGINTRTPHLELLKLAEIAGRLGVEGEENIRGFVKAADQIKVALGDSLGSNAEDSINAVGKLVDIFKVKDQFGLEQGMLKIGSAINDLGATSTANEGYIIDFAKRFGGIAPNAEISVQNVLALAATMDQLGQTSEVSTTALGQLLVAMGKDVPYFAKVAGVSTKEFAVTLKEDANRALIQVLNGAKNTSGGLAGMAKTLDTLGIDGSRAAGIVGVLSNNLSLLEQQQKLANASFEKGTSLTREFNIQNTSMGAIWDKIIKRFSAHAVSDGIRNFLTEGIKGFARLVGVIDEAEEAMDDFTNQKNKVEALESATIPLVKRYEELKEKTSLTGKEQKELRDIILKIAEAVPGAITQFDIYGNALDINAGKVRAFTREQQAMLALKNADAIAEQTKNLHGYLNALALIDKKLTTRDKDGDLAKVVTDSRGMFSELVKLTPEEIADVQREKAQAIKNIIGTRGLMNELKGIPSDFADIKKATGDAADQVDDPVIINSKSIEKEAEKAKKALDNLKLDLSKIKDELHKNTLSKEEQEIFAVKLKYEKLRGEAQKNKDILIQIAQLEAQELLQIQQSQAEKELDIQRKKNEERVKIADEMFLFALTDNEREQAELDAKYEDIINKADQAGLDTTHMYAIWSQAKTDLIRKQNIDEITQNREKNKKIYEDDLKMFNARAELARQMVNIVGAIWRLAAVSGTKNLEFQKALTIAQLFIDTASAISSVVAKNAATSLTPIDYAIKVGASVFTVLSNIATAREILKKAETPAVPAFARGGYSVSDNPSGYVSSPTLFAMGGRSYIAGEAGSEWIAPNWMLENPKTANVIGMLEAIRQNRVFEAGGFTGQSSTAPSQIPVSSPMDIRPLLTAIGSLQKSIDNMPKRIKAVINFLDIEEAEKRVTEIREETSI